MNYTTDNNKLNRIGRNSQYEFNFLFKSEIKLNFQVPSIASSSFVLYYIVEIPFKESFIEHWWATVRLVPRGTMAKMALPGP